MIGALDHAAYRRLFPALLDWVWLDTPGSPPGASPVIDEVGRAIASWSSGTFDWTEWDGAVDLAREQIAGYLGVDAGTVSALGSVAEATATVAGSLPPGRVVIAADEFRSTLMPWSPRHEIVSVPEREGVTRTEDLLAAIDERCTLVAVSELTTRSGARLDLAALRAATDAVGARLFVDLTQSLGVLRHDTEDVNADYLAVHGYKWLLCPRGAAWLVTRSDRLAELTPLAPNWHSTPHPRGYFGAPASLPAAASRCDASPAWLSWIGATAALPIHLGTDPSAVERHCTTLATELAGGLTELGFQVLAPGSSHIVVARSKDPDLTSHQLEVANIRAAVHGDRVRFGVHYFNNDTDIATCLDALTN